jgi:N-terminal acetyltransferase B complex non-catalytic subunit
LRYNLGISDLTVEKESARVALYTQQYLEGLKLGNNLPSTELQVADDLVILTGNVLVNIWSLTSDEGYLLKAVTLLEFALTKSKQSFQVRLILIRLYRLLGKDLQYLVLSSHLTLF